MPVEVKVPRPGESVTEGFLSVWYKRSGDYVQANEPLFELESDKATIKVPAPVSGVLTITVPEGKTVAVESVVGFIDEKASASAPRPGGESTPPAKAPVPPPAAKTPVSARPPAQPVAKAPPAVPVVGQPFLSPAARHVAAQNNLDLQALTGTGRGGRITKEDVLTHLADRPAVTPDNGAPPGTVPGSNVPTAAPAPAAGPPRAPERETRKRMSTIRQSIARRLVEAQQTAAILTTFNEADMSGVMSLRTKYKETFQKKHGVGLGFMSFFVKAVVEGLKAFPSVNARIDGTDIVYHNYYDIGVAVSTEKGLMVPVIRNCDQLSFAGVEKVIVEMAQKAREEKITLADLQGGTFTITNGGVFGSLVSTPILNPPQSAILGMHNIVKRPQVVNDQVVVRPMWNFAFPYDHRLVDGREAVQFLVRVKECIEDPTRLLLEI